jgi:DNA-binding SARP family transcriptional activator
MNAVPPTGAVSRFLRAVAASSAVLIALAAFAVLWRYRPATPDLPTSLSSPVTTSLIQELVLVAAWLLAGVLVLVVLGNSLLAIAAPLTRVQASNSDLALARGMRTRARSRPVRPEFPSPFPLVPRGPVAALRDTRPSPQRAETVRKRHHATVSIALLGPLKIAPPKRRGRGLRSGTQEFLVYLALRREGATTDELAAALWPDVDEDETARRRVWRSASEARSQLGDAVIHIGDRYVLDRSTVDVDLDRFNSLLAEAALAGNADREQLLERARALVRGEPLAGLDRPWAAGEVRHLRAVVAGLYQQLGELRLSCDPAAALACAEEAIALDPYAESAQRLAMRAEAALGLREAVIERYEGLSHELDAKLGLEPERETRLLYRRLLSQDAGQISRLEDTQHARARS